MSTNNKSSRPIILSSQFAKIHTNHGITQSKAASKDLRGVTFGYTPDRQIDKNTLILRYTSKPDGTIPRERITYESAEMAGQAMDVLKASINKKETRRQRKLFNTLTKKEKRNTDMLAQRTSENTKPQDPRAGLRRFLGADLSP